MARTKGTKHMNEESFKQVKLLQEAGLSRADIKRITLKSYSTQDLAQQAVIFEDYQEARRAANAKYKPTPPEQNSEPLPQHTEVQVTQISCTVDGYKVGENTYTTKVFGLGADNRLYYWDTQKAEPQWSLEK